MYFRFFFPWQEVLVWPSIKCPYLFFWKAEQQRIDAFELWCWRRLLRVPQMVRCSNQPILKDINPGYLLEGQMLRLKLQYFGYLNVKSQVIWKDPNAWKDWSQKGKRVRWLDTITGSVHMNLSKLRDRRGHRNRVCCSPWLRVGHMTRQPQQPFVDTIDTAESDGNFISWKLLSPVKWMQQSRVRSIPVLIPRNNCTEYTYLRNWLKESITWEEWWCPLLTSEVPCFGDFFSPT